VLHTPPIGDPYCANSDGLCHEEAQRVICAMESVGDIDHWDYPDSVQVNPVHHQRIMRQQHQQQQKQPNRPPPPPPEKKRHKIETTEF
jgi:hypothetical protein